MKYSVRGRQPYSVLKQADEIIIDWKDHERILDFIDKIPDKTIILKVPDVDSIHWPTVEMYSEKMNIILAIYDLARAAEIKSHGLRFCWIYAINNYYELQGICNLGPAYVILGAPLSFDLENVSKFNIPIRLIANMAYDPYIPRADGICGPWVRPEDIKYYEKYVDVIDFNCDSLEKEATLLKVYQSGKWEGNLNLLLDNLNVNIDNRSILEDLGERRMNCGQRCMENGACKLCLNAFKFSDLLRKKHYEIAEN